MLTVENRFFSKLAIYTPLCHSNEFLTPLVTHFLISICHFLCFFDNYKNVNLLQAK